MEQNTEALKVVENAIDNKLKQFEAKLQEGNKDESIQSELKNLSEKYSELSGTAKQLGELSAQLDSISAKQKTEGEARQILKSFNQVASDMITAKKTQFDNFAAKESRSFRFDIENGQNHLTSKAVGTVTLSNVSGELPTQIGNMVAPLSRKLHIRSLITNSPMTAATYSYPVLSDGEGTVGIQTEGSAKAQTDVDVEFKEKSPIVIAHWQRHSEQVLSDIPQLLSYVSGRMVEQLLNKEDAEILLGAGGSNRLDGILTGATAYVPTGSANVSTANRYSYLFDSISKLAQIDSMATGILINPYAYYEMLQVRSSDLVYTAPTSITFEGGTLRFAGVPVYQSTAMAANAFCVGDWSEVDLRIKNGISVDLSREDGDNFTKNLVTVRVEERIGLAVYRPASFIYGTFTTIAS